MRCHNRTSNTSFDSIAQGTHAKKRRLLLRVLVSGVSEVGVGTTLGLTVMIGRFGVSNVSVR